MSDTLLSVDAVTMQFGGVVALDDVTLNIRRGEILGLIGPNGAGKTTCFNVNTGVYAPTMGTVTFDDQPLAGLKRYQITKRGIARTFQNIRLFPEMTALENVIVGCEAHSRTGVISAMLRTRAMRREESEFRARALELLTFMGIADRADDAAKDRKSTRLNSSH